MGSKGEKVENEREAYGEFRERNFLPFHFSFEGKEIRKTKDETK